MRCHPIRRVLILHASFDPLPPFSFDNVVGHCYKACHKLYFRATDAFAICSAISFSSSHRCFLNTSDHVIMRCASPGSCSSACCGSVPHTGMREKRSRCWRKCRSSENVLWPRRLSVSSLMTKSSYSLRGVPRICCDWLPA